MARNPLIPSKPKEVRIIDLPKSAGILDDFAVRKNVATKEGTIEKVPVNDSDIVNKKYADELIEGFIKIDDVDELPVEVVEGKIIRLVPDKHLYLGT